MTAPVHYRILRYILTSKEPFLQTDVAEATGAARGQVSRLVRWLEAHHHVVRRQSDGRFEVAQPSSLILAMFPYQRVMSQALVGTTKVPGSMEDAARILSRAGATLCLESALAQYSEYFRADRVAAYHPDPKKLLGELAPNEGGLLAVHVYRIDIPLDGDQEGPDKKNPLRRTSRYRTLLDLVCDNRAYAAKDLFQQLWGVQFG
ncbi:MAG: MarR family transcriptional regulator [Thaumarchaeota archaeon]|nr:MarR family transcriptional regulator [Nitrososphaerota archaeon]